MSTIAPPAPNGALAAVLSPEAAPDVAEYHESIGESSGSFPEFAVYEPLPPAVKPSIFQHRKLSLFALWEIELQFRDKVMGGTPKDSGIIKSWLRAKAGIKQETELQEKTAEVLRAVGADVPKEATWDQIVAASEQLADNKAVGFRRDREGGLYLETRVVKAMIKECVSILWAGERWGATRKGPRSYAAERMFIVGDRIYLGRHQPDGTQLFVGHTTGPKGPQSNLTLYEYVVQPTITFQVMILQNCIPQSKLEDMLVLSEENGLAALRSQGFGRFNVTRLERLPDHLKKEVGTLVAAGDEPTEEEAARAKNNAPQISLDEKLAEIE